MKTKVLVDDGQDKIELRYKNNKYFLFIEDCDMQLEHDIGLPLDTLEEALDKRLDNQIKQTIESKELEND